MALQIDYISRFNNVQLKSGQIYSFSYQGYEHDPKPLIVFINRISGTHPRTGNQHRYIQGINLNYIGRSYRKQFAEDWVTAYHQTNGQTQFTWALVKRKYQYLDAFIRRYFTKPNYYIKNLKAIPFEHMKEEIEGNFFKDFSAKARIAIFSKYRQLQRRLM
jgi:hypothetical protein